MALCRASPDLVPEINIVTHAQETVDRKNITYREAAFLIGVKRVAHVAKLRGFI